jgi:hypothetical protein
VRAAEIAVVLLVGCGPRVADDPQVDPGTCEAPAADAIIAIALPATPWVPASLAFLDGDAAADCDVDLGCKRYDDLELPGGLEVSDSGKPTMPDHIRRECVCEDVGTSFSSGHCEESPVEGTKLWIESVTDNCVSGAIQHDSDEAPTPFVATICP